MFVFILIKYLLFLTPIDETVTPELLAPSVKKVIFNDLLVVKHFFYTYNKSRPVVTL